MMTDFINQIGTVLQSVDTNTFYKKTSLTKDFIVFEIEVYDKTFARFEGQVLVQLKYESISELLTKQQAVIDALDNFYYATDTSSANIDFVILNDLSQLENEQYFHELRFEFKLR